MANVFGPGWYRESSQVWLARVPATVDNSAGGNGSLDINVAIPARFDKFWEEIDASGDEVRVCGPDGVTLLDYAWSGFSQANRTGTLQIDATPISNGYAAQIIWIYWNSSGAASGATSVTITSPLTGTIWLDGVEGRTTQVFGRKAFAKGATEPTEGFSKTAAEALYVAFNLGPALRRAEYKTNGQRGLEGVLGLSYEVTNSAGSAQASMIEADSLRLVAGSDGLYALCKVKAGTTDTIYTVSLTATCLQDSSGGITDTTQILNPRCYCWVRTLLAT